jgi:hypothetical protein
MVFEYQPNYWNGVHMVGIFNRKAVCFRVVALCAVLVVSVFVAGLPALDAAF